MYLKDESAQPIGSFKLRGAYNKIAQLTAEELGRGVITYSSGNHAQGVAYAARALGAKAVIVMPEGAPQVKVDATRALGAEIVMVSNASSDRKRKAEELQAAYGYSMIPPYDDPDIIAGQATCGLEIVEQLRALGTERSTVVLVPVSGGGLLSGVAAGVTLAAAAAKASVDPTHRDTTAMDGPRWQIWGCEPELAGDAAESFRARTLIEWSAAQTTRTLCDGLRTQSLGALNFEHILRYVGGILTVTEDEIRTAMKVILRATGIVAEPSGAVTLATALFRSAELPKVERMVAVVSGGNIDPRLHAELEAEELAIAV